LEDKEEDKKKSDWLKNGEERQKRAFVLKF
jgi:hypothetical protein